MWICLLAGDGDGLSKGGRGLGVYRHGSICTSVADSTSLWLRACAISNVVVLAPDPSMSNQSLPATVEDTRQLFLQ